MMLWKNYNNIIGFHFISDTFDLTGFVVFVWRTICKVSRFQDSMMSKSCSTAKMSEIKGNCDGKRRVKGTLEYLETNSSEF